MRHSLSALLHFIWSLSKSLVIEYCNSNYTTETLREIKKWSKITELESGRAGMMLDLIHLPLGPACHLDI